MSVVNQIIDNAILTAQNLSTASTVNTNTAIQMAGGYSRFTPPTVARTEVDEPYVSIPSRVSGVDVTVFDSMYGKIIEDLADRFRGFLTEFFPINPALMPAVESWLQSAINGGTGINANVERQIWDRDRDRVYTESFSAQEQAINLWAGRGYPLPPGAAQAALLTIAKDRAGAVAAVSREAAIKAFETEVENIRFAIQQAIDYRTRVIAAAGDYIKALASAPDIASRMSSQSADAQARLISAVSGYYNARTQAAELTAKIDMYNADAQIKTAVSNQDTDAKYTGLRVDAAVSAAQALSQQAAAALNGLNATTQLQEVVG